MLAVAEGYERTGDPVRAARILRNAIEHFGTREYSVSPLLFQQEMNLRIGAMVDQAMGQTPVWMYGQVFASALGLAKNAVPLHESVLSPADPTITINVGNLALARLRELARKFPEVASMLESESRDVFAKADKDEKEFFLRSFPGTKAGQAALDDLATTARGLAGAEGRRRAWRLADTAEKAGYRVPDGLKEGLPVAQKILPGTTITAAKKTQEVAFEGSDVLRLILPRRDTANEKKELVFVGGRARKRLDNKFTLECYDVRDGKKVWGVADLRLKGVGQEPGFFEAFVHHKMVIVHGLYDVLAFDIADGHLLWRYRVPMDFEINQVMLAGDLLILSGDSGTLALYAPTTSAVGDVVWQTKEAGGVYIAPYVAGDRLVLVRHAPDNVTVRHLGSGELIGRMELPGLSATTMLHPLLPTVSDAQSAAHAGNLLMLIDGWSYYMIDTQSLSVRWKREIDSNDPGVVPPMRIALNDKVAVITKKDYDRGSMYGIDVATGEILWKTEHGKKKEQDALPALYDICMVGDTACGITVPGNQRFQLLVFNPATGEKVAEWKASGYGADPTVRMTDGGDGQSVVLTLLQGQKLQTVAVNAKTANVVATVEREGVGPFGTHGFASAGVCDGHLLLLTKNGVSISSGE
jgi:outer membrane protein assembly factor BamB